MDRLIGEEAGETYLAAEPDDVLKPIGRGHWKLVGRIAANAFVRLAVGKLGHGLRYGVVEVLALSHNYLWHRYFFKYKPVLESGQLETSSGVPWQTT